VPTTDEPPQDAPTAPSERVRLRRGPARGVYDPAVVAAILDAGLVAHVGAVTDVGPIVLPMAYGHDGTDLYLHGAVANGLLGSAENAELCATVTLVDGLVLARTPFHNSMNYRCVVVRGRGRRVTDPTERERALQLISDHVVATWDHGRAPSESDLRRTLVLAVPLAEASAKVRTGDPGDEPEDLDGPHWAGTVGVTTVFGTPEPAGDLRPGIEVPAAVRARFD
jgi:nitroimidazol reductase NimA-like FMN-containing flavoprotein (pyridoxamine 5'-phosphate oxidase superfamily)